LNREQRPVEDREEHDEGRPFAPGSGVAPEASPPAAAKRRISLGAISGTNFLAPASQTRVKPISPDELAETLMDRADVLPVADRTLLLAVYGEGRSFKEMGALTGESPHVVRCRVRRLVRRVLSAEYALVRARRAGWAPTRRRVAAACFLRGLSLREAALELNLTFHTVRLHHGAVLALAGAEGSGGGCGR